MNDDVPGADRSLDAHIPEVRSDGGWSSLDVVLEVLANRRRRYALYFLQDRQTATLREVSNQVAAWERNDEQAAESVPTDQVYTDFYHRHLPKLTAANVVDYDPREELVRFDCPELLEGVLDFVRWVEHPEDNED